MANKAHVMIRDCKVIQEPKVAQTATNSTWLKILVSVLTTKKQENSQYPATDLWNVNMYGTAAEKLIGQIHMNTRLCIIGDMYMGDPWTGRDGKVHISPVLTASSIDIIGNGTAKPQNNTDTSAPSDEEAPF